MKRRRAKPAPRKRKAPAPGRRRGRARAPAKARRAKATPRARSTPRRAAIAKPTSPLRQRTRGTPTTAAQWIKRFELQPHPEGGFYRELFRSRTIAVTRYPDGAPRAGLTTILFLLKRGQVSRWHRVASDESWHFHAGAPLELLTIDMPVGLAPQVRVERQRIEARRLGPLQPVLTVPAGAWQAAVSRGAYTLVSCSVGPGFEFDDFRMLDGVPETERPVVAPEFTATYGRFR